MLKRLAAIATVAVIAGTLTAGNAHAYSTFKSLFNARDLVGSGFHVSSLTRMTKKGKGYSAWINRRGEIVVRVATWYARQNHNPIHIDVRGNGGHVRHLSFTAMMRPGGGYSVSPT